MEKSGSGGWSGVSRGKKFRQHESRGKSWILIRRSSLRRGIEPCDRVKEQVFVHGERKRPWTVFPIPGAATIAILPLNKFN